MPWWDGVFGKPQEKVARPEATWHNKAGGDDYEQGIFTCHNKYLFKLICRYGLGNADKHYNFQKLIDTMNILEDYVEDEMLLIATTVFGDDIVIGIGKEENGSIFFKYHDRGKKYINLADTLCEFASKCKSEEIGHVRTIEERKQSMIEKGKVANITECIIKVWQAELDKYANIHQEEFEL